ncbi:hypothetical protein SynROS8604_01785 [Synechococcus sp. ROS8604]|nr:hypothetical protein SynROS8604_01785 [Synechococcus sp. ROS8604]
MKRFRLSRQLGLAFKSLDELLTMQLIGAKQRQSRHLVFAQIFRISAEQFIRKN